MSLHDRTEVTFPISEEEPTLKELHERFMEEDFRNDDHTLLFEKLSLEIRRYATSSGENFQNALRLLRNCCIQCHKNQNALLKTSIPISVLQFLSNVKTNSMPERSDKELSYGLQFLGNFTAGNVETQAHVFGLGYPDLFTCHLTEKYSPLHENRFKICSMVLYNCLDKDAVHIMLSSSDGLAVILSLCEALTLFSQLDWVVLSVSDYFLKDSAFLPFVLSECSYSAQEQVLGIYCDMMCEESNSENLCDHVSSVVCLMYNFLKRFKNLHKMPTLTDASFSALAMMLKTLCWTTANITTKQLSELVNETEFVAVIVKLLSDVSSSNGNAAENEKTIAAHLSISSGKRDLIRLIGNLCYNNPNVQNQIRSLGGISLVLQACAIDDDNPFMQQWAVFAIRNLCQNNSPNQTEIAKLEKLGVADSPVLKSMGLTAIEDESGKLRVVPIN